MSSITWSTKQWIKISRLLHFPFLYQPHHHLCLLHSPPLPNSRKQVDRNGIIGCLLDMRMLILSLCGRSRKKKSSQLQHYHACVCLCAIDCERPQIPLTCCENTSTGLPLILTPLFAKRIFTELEELIPCLFCHRLRPLFIEMNQWKCL